VPARGTAVFAPALLYASDLSMAPAPTGVSTTAQAPEKPVAQAAEQGKEATGGGWLAVIAKAFNFALLVAVLVYFLKAPLITYLNGRITGVRQDLVAAAETRDAASRQLVEIQTRLKALPAEIDALKRRGAEDIAAERVRIEQASETERQRLIQHTAREIEMKFRVARRELIEHAADRAVQLASERVRRSITADDQARLLDRYAAQLQPGNARP
jgi:F-type H+-transporting ATPase subunit b